MTVDEFLKKYNKCPFCRNYTHQRTCDRCCWRFGRGHYPPEIGEKDGFEPKQEWTDTMNREVDQ